MNQMLLIAEIIRKIDYMIENIKDDPDYNEARQRSNYCRGMIDTVIMMDYQCKGDELTDLAENLQARVCEALISAAMESKQDCSVILRLMEKRDMHRSYGQEWLCYDKRQMVDSEVHNND